MLYCLVISLKCLVSINVQNWWILHMITNTKIHVCTLYIVLAIIISVYITFMSIISLLFKLINLKYVLIYCGMFLNWWQKMPVMWRVGLGFNATFNNISVVSWWSVLLVEETGLPWENYRPAESHWQTLSHNVVSSTPCLSHIQTHNISDDRHWLHR